MYALVSSGVVTDANLSLNVWRNQHPQVSLPFFPSEAQLNEVGIYTVELTPQPPTDYTENAESSVVFNGTLCVQQWAINPASAEEITKRTTDQEIKVRTDRNQRLADCDWTQLADSPLDPDGKAAWALYRETLRMVPQQAGFPWNVQWPPVPGAN